MSSPKLPFLLRSTLEAAILSATGGVPAPQELRKARRPYERARDLTQKAAAKAAAVSGTLSMPPGPLGMLTLLPDLAFVWKIQAQMVVDIAAAFGHKKVTQEQMLQCLFKHVNDTALAEYEKARPIDQQDKPMFLLDVIDRVTRPKSRDLVVSTARQAGQLMLQQAVKRAASRLLPIAGAAVVATYSALDTKEVARTAVEMFSGEKLPPRKEKKDFPSFEEMFEARPIKEIDPDTL